MWKTKQIAQLSARISPEKLSLNLFLFFSCILQWVFKFLEADFLNWVSLEKSGKFCDKMVNKNALFENYYYRYDQWHQWCQPHASQAYEAFPHCCTFQVWFRIWPCHPCAKFLQKSHHFQPWKLSIFRLLLSFLDPLWRQRLPSSKSGRSWST